MRPLSPVPTASAACGPVKPLQLLLQGPGSPPWWSGGRPACPHAAPSAVECTAGTTLRAVGGGGVTGALKSERDRGGVRGPGAGVCAGNLGTDLRSADGCFSRPIQADCEVAVMMHRRM